MTQDFFKEMEDPEVKSMVAELRACYPRPIRTFDSIDGWESLTEGNYACIVHPDLIARTIQLLVTLEARINVHAKL